ncbi:hypothetical protein B0J14DRAFT_677730 [Halenospora varia]|nr:hypothetical protein B0J14DRAFT_677730 [Halenospora varia]
MSDTSSNHCDYIAPASPATAPAHSSDQIDPQPQSPSIQPRSFSPSPSDLIDLRSSIESRSQDPVEDDDLGEIPQPSQSPYLTRGPLFDTLRGKALELGKFTNPEDFLVEYNWWMEWAYREFGGHLGQTHEFASYQTFKAEHCLWRAIFRKEHNLFLCPPIPRTRPIPRAPPNLPSVAKPEKPTKKRKQRIPRYQMSADDENRAKGKAAEHYQAYPTPAMARAPFLAPPPTPANMKIPKPPKDTKAPKKGRSPNPALQYAVSMDETISRRLKSAHHVLQAWKTSNPTELMPLKEFVDVHFQRRKDAEQKEWRQFRLQLQELTRTDRQTQETGDGTQAGIQETGTQKLEPATKETSPPGEEGDL